MFAKTVLENGVRVLSVTMPDTRSVSLGIWVESGSRDEGQEQAGISHFVEHMLFKGTERRSAAGIAEEIDAVGGVLNAFTAKEYTCYYAKVLDRHFPLAADLLADVFLHSIFDPGEIERERTVILQEISQAEDNPEDFVHDLFSSNFFPNHPLGRPICGEAGAVGRLDRGDFLSFVRERYLPSRVVVAGAGNLKHSDLVRAMENALSAMSFPGGKETSAADVDRQEPPRLRGGTFNYPKPLEQVHLCLGVPSVHQSHPSRYVAHIVNTLLGGGMSSRLFQEIREKRGRAYSVYSFLAPYRDVGYLGVCAGTSGEWADEVVELTLGEMSRLAKGDVSAAEIDRAKNQLIGNNALGLETTDSWMSHIAKDEICFGRPIGLEEIEAGIRSVSLDRVVALAQETFRAENLVVTRLGDVGKNGRNPPG
jgi:predicted Zn-dependent peptidase